MAGCGNDRVAGSALLSGGRRHLPAVPEIPANFDRWSQPKHAGRCRKPRMARRKRGVRSMSKTRKPAIVVALLLAFAACPALADSDVDADTDAGEYNHYILRCDAACSEIVVAGA